MTKRNCLGTNREQRTPIWIVLCLVTVALLVSPQPAQAGGGNLVLAWSSPALDDTASVAWGDWDGDGDLDLAVGNNYGERNQVYAYEGGKLELVWISVEADWSESVAWGDWDEDGDLDLAVGNNGQPNRVYENVGGNLVLTWSSPEADETTSVDWGDWDGDGDLDLAVGNKGAASNPGQPNRVYENVGGNLVLAWSSPETDDTQSVTWGDWDGDGDLDLAMGNKGAASNPGQPNRVYENVGGSLILAWSSPEADDTQSVAWGDWDGDGDLDLAVGNDGYNEPNRVYGNSGGNLSLAWSSPEVNNNTQSVAWGDWDGDGDLDLAVGNGGYYYNEPNQVYENVGGSLVLAWSSPEADSTSSVAWGDWDGDGDLDLAVGNYSHQPSRIYANRGTTLTLGWASSEFAYTIDVAWGDWDNDGDLDLAVGNAYSLQIYANTGDELSLVWSEGGRGGAVAWGDWDNDGDLDLAAGGKVYANTKGDLVLVWSAPASIYGDVAWGDWDNDGDLDLAVGANVYENTREGFVLAWSAPAGEDLDGAIAWGDWDGDGDLDLAAEVNVYENIGGNLVLAWSAPPLDDVDDVDDVAWGDWDNDGDLDLVVAYYFSGSRVYENEGDRLNLVWSSGLDYCTSVAWGDWDNDGDLDLALGFEGAPIVVLQNSGGRLDKAWRAPITTITGNIAWGDWDNDGDLDLLAGDSGEAGLSDSRIKLYVNKSRSFPLAWSSFESENTNSIAWGDWDGDGDLDLAVGNGYDPNRVYENVGGGLELAWSSPEADSTSSVAWGDWDGDGDLDLAVGNDGYNEPNRVYGNSGGNLSLAWSSPEVNNNTQSVAWGDWDGDGDLDLAVGNGWHPNQVYENVGGSLVLAWSSSEADGTYSIAWGDWDGDGDLDLAVGNNSGPNWVYENVGGSLALAWSSPEADDTQSVAWGDWDGDGDLDLAVGNSECVGEFYCSQLNRVYSNEGGNLVLTWPAPELRHTESVAWGDWDGDGDLDLAVGTNAENPKETNYIYVSNGGDLRLAWKSPETDYTKSVAWGDWDSDGDLDLAVGNDGQPNRVYENQSADGARLLDTAPWVAVETPGTATMPILGAGPLLEGPVIPIAYKLFDPEGHSARFVRGYFSLDGGSTWQPAVAASGTVTTNLAASPAGTSHTFLWDVYASGAFGSTDAAVFRLDVYQGFQGPGPYQRAFRSGRSMAFRLRGSQVRVVDSEGPVSGAVVYRRPAGQSGAARPFADGVGRPFPTNPAGYLLGYGALGLGDELVALAPITATASYTLYQTSATPTETGLAAHTVTALGVQTLTVSPANPLYLFNLDVSLEWDARRDQEFLTDLEGHLQRASQLLYDVTNGQAALGRVRVYHDRAHWSDADLRIYATNRLRPHATIGGITRGVEARRFVDPGKGEEFTIAYARGRIHMPARWNRFGDAGGDLGEDWPRTLVHELGHYLLFLQETYLGLDAQGLPRPVEGCPGVMANPYLEEYTELHPEIQWQSECGGTLQQQVMKRSDWETAVTFYPWLKKPGESYAAQNRGPTTLPLEVTQVVFVEPEEPPVTVDPPLFYLVKDDGSPYQASSGARAYLFRGGNLVDLGQPRGDQLQAWGVRLGQGDRICVYDLNSGQGPYVGCQSIDSLNNQITMGYQAEWQPDITVSPVTTDTLAVSVGNLPGGLTLKARVYSSNRPMTATLPEAVSLVYDAASGEYRGTVPVSLRAYLHVWAENQPLWEIVTDFALSGAPTLVLGDGTTLVLGDGTTLVLGDGTTQVLADGGTLVLGDGTVLSIQDGTALVLGDGTTLVLGDGTTLALGDGTTLVLGDGTALVLGDGTTLALGDGTALVLGDGTTLVLGDGTTLALGDGTTLVLGDGTTLQEDGNGPVLSSDGQVVLYVDPLTFAPGEYYSLQAVTRLPAVPGWVAQVGQAYRLLVSPGAPDAAGQPISFRYLGRDVPNGEAGEKDLGIYYYDGAGWQPLTTFIDEEHNSAVAQTRGPGIYALFSTIQVPLQGQGWNLFNYASSVALPVQEALASIQGKYSTVYHYQPNHPDGPWLVFDIAMPYFVNSLKRLEPRKAYWLYATEPITNVQLPPGAASVQSVFLPPSSYYGVVQATADFTPAPGMEVSGWIGGVRCGQGVTVEANGAVWYRVYAASEEETAGCGAPGRRVRFQVGGVWMDGEAPWDNTQVQNLPLGTSSLKELFLPLVER